MWRKHRSYALTAGTSAGINSLAGQIPILLPAVLYGDQAAGLLAMALRILVSPLGLIGNAAAAAAVGEISQALRTRSGQARAVLRRGLLDLAVIGAVPAFAAGTLGMVAVPYLLGEQWAETGTIVAALALGAWAQFVVAPFSQTLNLSGRSSWLLVWDVCGCAVTGAFLLPSLTGLGIVAASACYSVAMLGLYARCRSCAIARSRPGPDRDCAVAPAQVRGPPPPGHSDAPGHERHEPDEHRSTVRSNRGEDGSVGRCLQDEHERRGRDGEGDV